LTEVLFPSFHTPPVPNLIKNKTEGAKNKGRKAQGANMYLTLRNMFLISVMGVGTVSGIVTYVVSTVFGMV
jgi:hypothetical protein